MQLASMNCAGAPGGNCYDINFNVDRAARLFKDLVDANGGNVLVAAGGYNGWRVGMTSDDAQAARWQGNCHAQNNLDYLHQLFNGWCQGRNGYGMGSWCKSEFGFLTRNAGADDAKSTSLHAKIYHALTRRRDDSNDDQNNFQEDPCILSLFPSPTDPLRPATVQLATAVARNSFALNAFIHPLNEAQRQYPYAHCPSSAFPPAFLRPPTLKPVCQNAFRLFILMQDVVVQS